MTIEMQQLENISSASELLELTYNKPLDDIELPINPEEIISRISKLEFNKEFSFDDWDNSGYIKVNRKNENLEKITIWVNPSEAPVRQRFTASHELGHLIHDVIPSLGDSKSNECFEDKLHRNGNRNFRETRANKFSAQLLMPAKLVKKEVSKLVTQLKSEKKKVTVDEVITKLSSIFHVSEDAMTYRLKTLGYIK